MTARHRAREVALQILYGFDTALQKEAIPPSILAQEIQKHYNHFQIQDGLREFSALLVAGTIQTLKSLDEMIETHASHWKVQRMPMIDRMLLRMAVYELVHLTETPPSVVINEAVELAKQFGTADTPGFVNGVLDSIRKSHAQRS